VREVKKDDTPAQSPRDPEVAASLARGMARPQTPAVVGGGMTAAQAIGLHEPGGALGTARRPRNPVDLLSRMHPLSLIWMLGAGVLLLGFSGVCALLSRPETPYSRAGQSAQPAPPLLRFARKEW
jgi:hypothetical protein